MATEAKSTPPQRIEGPTPNGGAYAIAYTRDDGSIEIVEFTPDGQEIMRTYSRAAGQDASPKVEQRPFSE